MGSKMIHLIKEETPIVSTLKNICRKGIYSFHALPLSSFGQNDILGESEIEVFHKFETTITNEAFDNFFFSTGVISESQKKTASLYNADASFYITGGTSVANQIAITALHEKGDLVLIDKNCHQSIHFHTQSIGARVDYLCPDLSAAGGQLSAWSVEHLKNKILDQQAKGKGYDLIILTAQSYEGMIYDIPGVLSYLMEAGVTTRKFFIDEAWGSLNYFSDDTSELTVMHIDSIREKYPDINLVCTQSAHKSLYCLRQASLIHCKGDEKLPNKIEVAKFRIHTTSPNYPILASLDMAQAQMAQYGEQLAKHSRELAAFFCDAVNQNPILAGLGTNIYHFPTQWHIHQDPTKVLLDISVLDNAITIKKKLLAENIFIKRTLDKSILLNFHIGINRQAVNELIKALITLFDKYNSLSNKDEIKISDKFIITYPPGVPIVFPGDKIDESIQKKINSCKEKGLLIIAA
ncbi:lysine decarboxylase [Sodalis ligni]|jgi:arginine decarboxylase|uniref:Arginine/lysine/ornithine decarboxylase n=1 Tax=Sodalis ligni TaxID=2697027 RepID=A0A4R1NG55_9GAMM|nr:lysine decarboxylase [Sodalis ligni]TCL03120.1 arginine/lysine/ornithine decarboxylase [Sodalis ligni]